VLNLILLRTFDDGGATALTLSLVARRWRGCCRTCLLPRRRARLVARRHRSAEGRGALLPFLAANVGLYSPKRVDLAGCAAAVRDAELGAAAHRDLRSLDLSGCVHVTDDGLELMLTTSTGLQRLRLATAGGQLTGESLRLLGSLQALIALDLGGCGGAVGSIARSLRLGSGPGLQQLSLAGLVGLETRQLEGCLEACPQLRTLDMRVVLAATDTTLALLARACPLLEELVLNGCPCVLLEPVTVTFSALRCLELRGCQPSSLRSLFSETRFPALEAVDARGCATLSDAQARVLRKTDGVWTADNIRV